MIDLPGTDHVRLLTRSNFAATFVIVAPSRPSPVIVAGGTADIRRSLSWYVNSNLFGAMFRDDRPDIPVALWCQRDAAGRIVEAVTRRPRGGQVATDVDGAVAMVRAAAQRHRVGLADHETTMARARANVGAIANRVEAARENGGLAEFNTIYRARRLAAQKSGARMMPYGMALSRLRRAIGERAAAQATGTLPPDILAKVFGA